MSGEGGGGGMTTKEEEDNAWWSDYQASTKLRRKLRRQEETDHDNFDDLLSDLDSIKSFNSIPCDKSPVRNSSRKSSTSGYETLSSVCTTPDFKGKNIKFIFHCMFMSVKTIAFMKSETEKNTFSFMDFPKSCITLII